ncbi:unnamed protein product [Cuscuta europaea]|uniref:Uncharacterized protein n=1 Tax=Cuscuta europaea TaxID=41803 RepID=A0A9P1A293_CUSEU|nr:unnamed protein product [Cuscuta europaea]
MWDEIFKIMQETEIDVKAKKANTFTTYDSFKAKLGESLEDNYIRFLRLINEMGKINVQKFNMELNVRFLSSLAPKWRKVLLTLYLPTNFVLRIALQQRFR